MKYEKKVRMQRCSFQKDLQFHQFLMKHIFFVLILKYTIKIQKFHFLDKIYEIHKKRLCASAAETRFPVTAESKAMLYIPLQRNTM